jgi:hypothetical protein
MPLSITLLAPPGYMPSGWPVVEPDLLMGYVGSVMVVRLGGGLSASGFARYLAEWTRAIDARPESAAVFALYDIPDWPGMTATQRRNWGVLLKSREETLRRTTVGMVLATPSALTRGGARAVLWLAPPPYPYAVVDTTRAAFGYIAERNGPPPEAAFKAYEALICAHWMGSDG